MKLQKIIFIAILALINKTHTMFFPFYPLYTPSIIVMSSTEPDILNRKWLNRIYSQNNSITTSQEVRSNIDYYHAMVKNHYNYLASKHKHKSQIQRIKLKRLLISSGISAVLWSAVFYCIYKAKTTPFYDDPEKYVFLAGISAFFGFFSAIFNIVSANSYFNHDTKMQRNLQRDLHMLEQFEEYKLHSNN